MKVSRDVVAGC